MQSNLQQMETACKWRFNVCNCLTFIPFCSDFHFVVIFHCAHVILNGYSLMQSNQKQCTYINKIKLGCSRCAIKLSIVCRVYIQMCTQCEYINIVLAVLCFRYFMTSWNTLFRVSRIQLDSQKLGYFGTKF